MYCWTPCSYGHQRTADKLEQDFKDNNAQSLEARHLSIRPKFVFNSHEAPYLWGDTADSCKTDDDVEDHNVSDKWTSSLEEAEKFQHDYQADVQFVFSRVQRHWHTLDEKGDRVPLPYCRLKGTSKRHMC